MSTSPDKPLLNDTIAGTIIGPDGVPMNRPAVFFTNAEAETLRAYKTLMRKYHLREAVFCNDCLDSDTRDDGMRGWKQEGSRIFNECRCRQFHTPS